MSFKRITPWTSQPQYPVAIDRSNPLNKALVFAWSGAQKSREAKLGIPVTTDNTQQVASVKGLAADCTLAQINIEWNRQFCTTSTGDGLGDFTQAVLANPVSVAAVQHVFAQKNDAAAPYAQTGLYSNTNAAFDAAAGSFAFNTYNAATSGVTATGQVDGAWHLWVGVRRAGTLELWRDGVLQASAAGLTIRAITQALERYTAIGSRGNGTTEGYPDSVAFATMYDRALSASEVKALSDNPWQIFQPLSRRIFVESAATGSVGASDGIATVSATGASTAASPGSSAGIAAVSGVGAATTAGTGASAGIAAVLGTGAATGSATGASDGISVVTGTGASTSASTGASDGIAVGSGTGISTATATGSSAGVATVDGIAPAANDTGAGASAGVAVVLGVGASTVAAVGASVALATVNGISLTADVVGGGIGHGGTAKRRPRLVRVEEAQTVEEVLAEIEAEFQADVRVEAKNKAKRKQIAKPVVEQQESPAKWLDYYQAQARLLADYKARQNVAALIDAARDRVRMLQAAETLIRIEDYNMRMEEEDMMLLLMAA